MGDILTATQLADMLSVSPSTVKRWTRDGRIPAHRIGGKVIRYDADEVRKALFTDNDDSKRGQR